jgi:hypothetical protein
MITQSDGGPASWVSVVIPTRSSAPWIERLLEHYLAHGVRPIILLDERSTDGTADRIAACGLAIHRIGPFPFTEAIVRRARDVVPTPWALWMHDDECPSEALFDRLAGPPPPSGAQSVAIQRRWVWHQPGEPLRYGVSDGWADRTGRNGTDYHWRLFRPDRVDYVAVMHSDGFRIDRWSRLEADCYIAHFEWVARTRMQRIEKLRAYDAHRYGYGVLFRSMYVPEDQPPGTIDFRPFETTAFDGLADAYLNARQPDRPPPPVTLRERWQPVKARMLDRLRGHRFQVEPPDRRGLTPRPENEIPDTAIRAAPSR